MTPEEKQLIEQRQYGLTIAQVAQLVANHDGCAIEYSANTAKIAAQRLASIVASHNFSPAAVAELDGLRVYLNRIQLALNELDNIETREAS